MPKKTIGSKSWLRVTWINKADNMKNLLSISLIIIAVSCNKNQPFTDKIKDKLTKDAMGLDLKYKSLDLKFMDTIYIKDIKDSLRLSINQLRIKLVQDSDFLLDTRTPRRLSKLREKLYERVSRIRLAYGINYEMDPMSKDMARKIDLAISNFKIEDKPYKTWSLVSEYKTQEAYSYKLNDIGMSYIELTSEIWKAESKDNKIDSLATYPDNKPIFYKVYNKYSIHNPLFSNAKQTIESVFTFDDKVNIVKREN
jgi:hypothetical protein